jgi:hypothetical protein
VRWLRTPIGNFAVVAASFAATLGLMSLLVGPASSAEPTTLMCGRDLRGALDLDRPASPVRVALLLTQGWLDTHGAESETEARWVIAFAGGVFRGLNLSLVVVRVEVDEGPVAATDPKTLLSTIKSFPVPDGADIVVAFMGVSESRRDGAGEIGGRHAVVAAHPRQPQRDTLVAAHEIAHVLGVHHGCDGEAGGGVMAPVGFVNPHLVCPCTWTALENNLGRFSG